LDNKYHFKRYELFGKSKKLLVLSSNFPDFSVNSIFGYCEDIYNIVFIPNHSKYGNFWHTGYELGSLEDEFNNDYQKEINVVKQYRFYK
jgi:hypothetical protein